MYGPGLPGNYTKAVAQRFDAVDQATNDFIKGTNASALKTKDWSTHEWLHFIRALPDSLSTDQMKDLDKRFHFTDSKNSEIQAAWYELAIQQGYGREILPAIRTFLVNV